MSGLEVSASIYHIQYVRKTVSLCLLQKERRLLENLRLDLDACKTRLKKAKMAEAKATVSHLPPPH